MKISAVILLTLIAAAAARDSCENFDDYLCGDVCISLHADCHCGNDIARGYYLGKNYYRCIPPGDD